jgi:hypothetical protein
MRVLLGVAGLLVFLAGVQLFVFPLRTDRYFSWTIAPPMTAVFLGASYWSALAFEWSAAAQRRWSDARIAIPTVFVFTALTLVATLIHVDKFHFGTAFGAGTRAVTWAWLAIYVLVPIIMVVLWVSQTRQPGTDAPRLRPLSTPVRLTISIQAVLLLGMGLALFISPLRAASWWPWALTPLTGRAIGAWCIGLGVAAAQARWENDVRRLQPAAFAFAAFGLLQSVSLLRHGGDLDWDRAPAWIYLAFVISAAVVGAIVLVEGRGLTADEGESAVVDVSAQERAANDAKSTDLSSRVDS